MRVLMKVTPGNSTTDQLLVRSWPQLRSSSCDWYYLHYAFLLGPLTRAQCLQEKQKNHRPDTISDTHMLCSFASFIYDLSYSFTQCNLNSNSLKRPVSHDSRTDEPCFAASAFASHTELICRTFQKTRTSSGNLNRAGLRSRRSDFTPNATLRQMENVDTLFGHYTVHILYLTSF